MLFSGRPPEGRTRKLNAMIVGLQAARGELIASADSDIPAARINALHAQQGGTHLRPRHAWVGFALLMTAPFVMLWILSHRQVTWRGRSYALNRASRLASPAVPDAVGAHGGR